MITFDDAYQWLNMFDSKRSHLSEPTKQLLNQMNEALIKKDFIKVWKLIERLERISGVFAKDLEMAETRLECARAYFKMELYPEAVKRLDESISKYNSHWHNWAVAQWMRGYVRWKLPHRHDEAIVDWQGSLEKFEDQARRFSSVINQADWYRNQCIEMRESIKKAIEDDGVP